MNAAVKLIIAALLMLQPVLWAVVSEPAFAQTAAPSAASPALDYDVFKTKVQPIFLAARTANGNARCVACHSRGAGAYLEPLRRRGSITTSSRRRCSRFS